MKLEKLESCECYSSASLFPIFFFFNACNTLFQVSKLKLFSCQCFLIPCGKHFSFQWGRSQHGCLEHVLVLCILSTLSQTKWTVLRSVLLPHNPLVCQSSVLAYHGKVLATCFSCKYNFEDIACFIRTMKPFPTFPCTFSSLAILKNVT